MAQPPSVSFKNSYFIYGFDLLPAQMLQITRTFELPAAVVLELAWEGFMFNTSHARMV